MSVTLKDVARHAGVSTATVSRVISDDLRISEETKRLVRRSIKALAYEVNVLARSLKTRRSQTVGLITPEIANDFFMAMAQGAENELRRRGYSLIICNSNERPAEESKRIKLLRQKRVDGLIIIPAGSRGAHIKRSLGDALPVVLADRLVNCFEADAVTVDNAEGARAAVSALFDRGYRRVGFISGDLRLSPARERHAGYAEAFSKRGVEPDLQLIRFGDFHEKSGYTLMKSLLETRRPPEAVFIANYYMNVGATRYLAENRRRWQGRIFLAAFDDMALSSVSGFPCITIAQPIEELGTMAARLLADRLEERRTGRPPCPTRLLRLPTRLVVHE